MTWAGAASVPSPPGAARANTSSPIRSASRCCAAPALRPKACAARAWDEFAAPGAPAMDLVITVCDNAAGEACPIWPGHPATAHWGYADPSEGDGTDAEKREAFRQTLHAMKRRLDLLVALPQDKLAQAVLQTSVRRLATD